jgi:hypothetical protein
MDIIREYRTTDIVLAAYICSEGLEVAKIECSGNRGTFVFNDVRESLIERFDAGSARVEPMSFNMIIRRLTTAVRRKVAGS